MSNARFTRAITLVVIFLLASAVIGYYLINRTSPPAPTVQQPGAQQQPDSFASGEEKDGPGAQHLTTDLADKGFSETKRAFREDIAARRTARIEAYNKIPAEERARSISQRWELTGEQEQQIAEILARFTREWAELEKTAMADADRARAQQSLQARQIQAMTPILADSPALERSKQRFIDAGVARGGKLVRPAAE